MVVPRIPVAQTCRFVPISRAASQIEHAPVTYVAGGDVSALVTAHTALLVSWYELRASEQSR